MWITWTVHHKHIHQLRPTAAYGREKTLYASLGHGNNPDTRSPASYTR